MVHNFWWNGWRIIVQEPKRLSSKIGVD